MRWWTFRRGGLQLERKLFEDLQWRTLGGGGMQLEHKLLENM